MRCSFLIAAAAILATPGMAMAACQPQFETDSEAVTFTGVTIEADGSASQDVSIQVTNPAGGPPEDAQAIALPAEDNCPAAIRINKLAGGLDPNFPPYHVLYGGQEVAVLPPGGGSSGADVPIANVPGGPTGVTLPLQFIAETEWGLPAGNHIEQLEVSLINQQGAVVDTLTLSLAIEIPRAASLSIVGAVLGNASGAQINLGTLSTTTQTTSEPFGALILSTAPYQVGFNSGSGGFLVHTDGVAMIPYRFYFDGREVNLAGGDPISYPHHTSGQGDSRPMSIVVPPVPGQLAGSYSDRLTVTVTAL